MHVSRTRRSRGVRDFYRARSSDGNVQRFISLYLYTREQNPIYGGKEKRKEKSKKRKLVANASLYLEPKLRFPAFPFLCLKTRCTRGENAMRPYSCRKNQKHLRANYEVTGVRISRYQVGNTSVHVNRPI